MTDKKEFKKQCENIELLHGVPIDLPNEVVNKLWSYFQSKQQEKIERVKRLKLVKTDHCDACRALVTGYEVAIEDVLSIMEEKK